MRKAMPSPGDDPWVCNPLDMAERRAWRDVRIMRGVGGDRGPRKLRKPIMRGGKKMLVDIRVSQHLLQARLNKPPKGTPWPAFKNIPNTTATTKPQATTALPMATHAIGAPWKSWATAMT